MAPGMKYVYAGVLLLALLFCSAVSGFFYGKSVTEKKYSRATSDYFDKWATVMSSVANSYAELAAKTKEKQAEVRYITKEIIREGETHVKETQQTYPADSVLIDLRLCAFDTLYRATGADLPAGREGASCPATVSDQH